MFSSASSFNQPVEAWDVGQVTTMYVRRRPASGSQGSCTHTRRSGGHKPCVRVLARRRGCSPPQALSTSLWLLGMLASSKTWGCAAALHQGHRAPAHTKLLRGVAATSRECVCWRGAGDVQWRELLQPACGCMGRRPGHRHAGAPPPCVNVAGFSHIAVLGGAATYCVRVLARHSICSETQALSTSVWLHGTLVGSPTWLCAAPLCVGLVRT